MAVGFFDLFMDGDYRQRRDLDQLEVAELGGRGGLDSNPGRAP